MGTLGPGPTPLARQTNPRVSKGKCLNISRPMNAPPTFRLGAWGFHSPDGLFPPTLRPGAWGFHSPNGLFSSGIYFPKRQFSQEKLPPGSPFYKRKFINLHHRLRQDREVLLITVISGRWLRKGKNESPSPK